MTRSRGSILGLSALAASVHADAGRTFIDAEGDASIRRTDPGVDGPLPTCDLPDLLWARVAGWEPADPVADPWTGVEDGVNPHIVRIDVVFKGLWNPSGSLGLDGSLFEPEIFGARPLVGFLDIDIDSDKDTGGELGGAATFRYLANAARFGGRVSDSLGARAAISGEDFDLDFFSSPQYERSGADFSLVLCGCETPLIMDRACGDDDDLFEKGETWVVRGRFFERARGYQDASFVFGGSDFGLYDPPVDLRFEHDEWTDQTTISLVFPLDQAGAAMLTGEPIQPIDSFVGNHVSIVEAVQDLIDAANGFIPEPARTLTEDWDDREVEDAIEVDEWRLTALFGLPYAAPDEGLYAWSDIGFAAIPGDYNGDKLLTIEDGALFNAYLEAHDGDDGYLDDRVAISNFGPNFSLFDANYDGVVDLADAPRSACRADLTGSSDPGDPRYGVPDGIADAADVFYYLDRFGAGSLEDADLTGSSDPLDPLYGMPDGHLDAQDFFFFLDLFLVGCD